jgi:hypothetical protein
MAVKNGDDFNLEFEYNGGDGGAHVISIDISIDLGDGNHILRQFPNLTQGKHMLSFQATQEYISSTGCLRWIVNFGFNTGGGLKNVIMTRIPNVHPV